MKDSVAQLRVLRVMLELHALDSQKVNKISQYHLKRNTEREQQRQMVSEHVYPYWNEHILFSNIINNTNLILITKTKTIAMDALHVYMRQVMTSPMDQQVLLFGLQRGQEMAEVNSQNTRTKAEPMDLSWLDIVNIA